jgi:hypothetical protein
MSQELNNEVVRQFYRAKRVCMKKRRFEGVDAGPETPQARRVRLDESVSAADPYLGDYVDRPTLAVISAAGDIAVTPMDSFQGLVARELCNRANTSTSTNLITGAVGGLVDFNDVSAPFTAGWRGFTVVLREAEM